MIEVGGGIVKKQLEKSRIIKMDLDFYNSFASEKEFLSHDVASGSDITTCIKIDKPQVVCIFNNVTYLRCVYMAHS